MGNHKLARRRRARKPFRWVDTLGLIPWLFIIAAIVFGQTEKQWYDDISHGDKALFWASAATAAATIGLFVVAAIAASVAYRQLTASRDTARIQATTDLLREWSLPSIRAVIARIDLQPEPQASRRFLRLLYRLTFSDASKPRASVSNASTRPTAVPEWRKKNAKAKQAFSDDVEMIAFMASRTWNLLAAEIVDKNILFQQLDYDIVSTYYILEDILAIRQCRQYMLYSEFTALAKSAQAHYKRRNTREIFAPLIEVDFDALPYNDDELDAYMVKALSREAAWRIGRQP